MVCLGFGVHVASATNVGFNRFVFARLEFVDSFVFEKFVRFFGMLLLVLFPSDFSFSTVATAAKNASLIFG